MKNSDFIRNVIRCKDCIHRGSDIECPMCHEEEYYDEDLGWDSIYRDRTIDDGFAIEGNLMKNI